MPTLLHISDLHRTSTPRLDNDELLSAILSDAKRWEEEGIPYPEAIVVSGDLIQGTSVDHPNPDAEIASQYAEVGAYLGVCLKIPRSGLGGGCDVQCWWWSGLGS